jgi:hypothetical protein
MIMNKVLERRWEVQVTVYLMLIYWDLPEAMKENYLICRKLS